MPRTCTTKTIPARGTTRHCVSPLLTPLPPPTLMFRVPHLLVVVHIGTKVHLRRLRILSSMGHSTSRSGDLLDVFCRKLSSRPHLQWVRLAKLIIISFAFIGGYLFPTPFVPSHVASTHVVPTCVVPTSVVPTNFTDAPRSVSMMCGVDQQRALCMSSHILYVHERADAHVHCLFLFFNVRMERLFDPRQLHM